MKRCRMFHNACQKYYSLGERETYFAYIRIGTNHMERLVMPRLLMIFYSHPLRVLRYEDYE